MVTNSFIIFFLSWLFFLYSPALSTLWHPLDKQAHLKIKNDINKNNPKIDFIPSWTPNIESCNDWYGVCYDKEMHCVTDLLDSKIVVFQLPLAISDLPYLTSLQFHKNPNLISPIQVVIAKFTRLTFLCLDWNGLSGWIPNFLGKLKELTYITSLTTSLGQLPFLRAISAYRI